MDKPKRNCSAIADTEYGRVTQRFLSTALAMIAVLVAPMVCAARPLSHRGVSDDPTGQAHASDRRVRKGAAAAG